MWFSCGSHVVLMRFSCGSHVVLMSFSCGSHVVLMLFSGVSHEGIIQVLYRIYIANTLAVLMGFSAHSKNWNVLLRFLTQFSFYSHQGIKIMQFSWGSQLILKWKWILNWFSPMRTASNFIFIKILKFSKKWNLPKPVLKWFSCFNFPL